MTIECPNGGGERVVAPEVLFQVKLYSAAEESSKASRSFDFAESEIYFMSPLFDKGEVF